MYRKTVVSIFSCADFIGSAASLALGKTGNVIQSMKNFLVVNDHFFNRTDRQGSHTMNRGHS